MDQLLTYALAGLASRLGRFERQLLLSIEGLGDDAYCAELTRRLSVKLAREVSMGQTSRTLAALKQMGLLSVTQKMPKTPQKNQRSRLVYGLTEGGRQVISALAAIAAQPPDILAPAAT